MESIGKFISVSRFYFDRFRKRKATHDDPWSVLNHPNGSFLASRYIPRIERHRFVRNRVLTHRGWVAWLHRNAVSAVYESSSVPVYDNGTRRRERRSCCSPKVFRNRREASTRRSIVSMVTADEVSSISSDLVAQCSKADKTRLSLINDPFSPRGNLVNYIRI